MINVTRTVDDLREALEKLQDVRDRQVYRSICRHAGGHGRRRSLEHYLRPGTSKFASASIMSSL